MEWAAKTETVCKRCRSCLYCLQATERLQWVAFCCAMDFPPVCYCLCISLCCRKLGKWYYCIFRKTRSAKFIIVLSIKRHSLETVTELRTVKLVAVMYNDFHPLHATLDKQRSFFGDRMIHTPESTMLGLCAPQQEDCIMSHITVRTEPITHSLTGIVALNCYFHTISVIYKELLGEISKMSFFILYS